jgi:carbon-monoxide dehydrogenase small subunit
MMSKLVRMKINREARSFFVGHGGAQGEIPDEETLLQTLRERMNLTGAKESCGQGACGCCTILLDSKAVPSCQILTADCDGADILTIEGLQDPVTGELDPIQRKIVDNYAFQCGFCTPGIIMSLKGLFLKDSRPSTQAIKEALSGNMCRCISQYRVIEAAEELARETV